MRPKETNFRAELAKGTVPLKLVEEVCWREMSALPKADISRTTWGPDVYPPSDDSFALVDALEAYLQAEGCSCSLCLEVGCGSGYVITSFLLMVKSLGVSSQAIATDINSAAIRCTTQTLADHGVTGVDAVRTDLISGMLPKMAKKIDILLFNPPYVPTTSEEVHQEGISRSWAGGIHGREVIDRFLPLIQEVLAPGGQVFMVTVSENNPKDVLDNLARFGLVGKEVLTRSADEERLHILQIGREI